MAGTNTPAVSMRMMRMGGAGATTGLAAGHAHGGGGGGGTPRGAGGRNPLAAGHADAEGTIPYQQAPVTGIPSLLLHPLIQKMYDDTTDRSNAKRQEDLDKKSGETQAALDSYQKAMDASPTNPHAALLNWAASPEGHQALLNGSMDKVGALHQILTSPDPNGQPQSVPLGGGLTGVNLDGKWHVFTPKQMEGTSPKMVKGPGGEYGTVKVDPVSGKADFTPATVGGQEQPPNQGPIKVTPDAISTRIRDIDQVLGSVAKMQANLGATGSLGWGSANKFAAIHSPLGGPQAQAYAEAYAQAQPALQRLLKAGGFSGKELTAQVEQILPSPGKATAFILNQQLPALSLQYRNQIAGMYTSLKAENRVGGAGEAQAVAQRYDAHPEHMKAVADANAKLQTQPSALTPDQVSLLHQEAAAGRLPYDSVMKVHRQMAQLQMIPLEDLSKAATADPNFKKTLDPAELRPDARPPIPRAMMGAGPDPTQPVVPPPISMPGGPGARLPQDQPGGAASPGRPPVSVAPNAPPTPGADLGASNIQRMLTLDQPAPAHAVGPGQQAQPQPPAPAEGVPAGTATAPLPPAPGAQPPPEQRTDAGPGSVFAGLNPISSAMAAEAPPGQQAQAATAPAEGARAALPPAPQMAEDRGAQAGATPLPDDVRQLLFQINQSTAAHLAGSAAPPPAAPTGNQEGVTIPLPKRDKSED